MEVVENTKKKTEAGGKNAGSAPSARPRPRRCSSPRAVRRRLIDVARRLDEGRIDAMTANALANVYRLILQTITENDLDVRLKRIELAMKKAAEAQEAYAS